MRLSEIEIGGRYAAKVSGRLVVVRVNNIRTAAPYRGRSRTAIDVVNERTGRSLTFRSAARLRYKVRPRPEASA
ncbi:MAG: hypothetical protein D6744_16465 [Planctomycetota bacterium]|nr:MAG: hypothetical protein D6744_16465 [Planctomycetota bacterium]